MPVKCFVLRPMQKKAPQMFIYVLSQWEQRFEDKMGSGLENRQQCNTGKT